MTNDNSPQALRAHWTLDPELIYLNHGSFGACPRPVLEAQTEFRARIERDPIEVLGRRISDSLAEVKEALGAFVGAAPADLALVSNATTGVNAVLRSLDFAPGDELLFTDHGYNACNNAVRFVAERTGAQAVAARVPFPLSSPDEAVGAILAAVTPRTRLALIDHITSPTGIVLPIEGIIGELHERGVEVLVDGAHAPGMVDLNVEALGADYYTGNCHKWLCTPKGAGFLHVRREHQPRIRPTVISHGANAVDSERSRFQLEFDWVGTNDPTPLLCIPVAIDFLGSLLPGGWAELRTRNHDLALTARGLLCDALDCEPPAPAEMIGTLVSVPLPVVGDGGTRDIFATPPIQAALRRELRIEVPVFCWPTSDDQVLRISAQVYNDEEQYRTLASGLPALLRD